MLKFICCIDITLVLACVVTIFVRWWEKRPIIEEKESPFYITKTYEDIKNGQRK